MKKKEVYLVGYEEEKLSECKLPTIREVLSVFFYKYKTLKIPFAKSLSETVNEVQIIWGRADIPTRRIENIVKSLKKIFHQWDIIRKNASRKESPAQKIKEKNFQRDINGLFDIAKHDTREMMTEDQLRLLSSQRRSTRQSSMKAMPSKIVTSETDNSSHKTGERPYIHFGNELSIFVEIIWN